MPRGLVGFDPVCISAKEVSSNLFTRKEELERMCPLDMLENHEVQVLRRSGCRFYRPAPNRLAQQSAAYSASPRRVRRLTTTYCFGVYRTGSITQELGSFRSRELKRTAPLPTQLPVCTEWSSVKEWFLCLVHFCKIQTTAGKEEEIRRSHTWHIYCQTNWKLAGS